MALSTLIMSGHHLGRQAGGFEPARQNNGLLWIEGLAGFGETSTDGNGCVVLSLESFPFPKVRQDPIELPFLNTVRKVPGQIMVDEIEVVLRDFVDKPVLLTLQNWRNAVGDSVTGQIGLSRHFKRTAYAVRYSPDGLSSRAYRLDGVWPSMVDPGDHDMGSSEKCLINLSLQVDRAYPVTGYNTGSALANWGGEIRFPLRFGAAVGAVAGAILNAAGG
jgi:hypothetical protein